MTKRIRLTNLLPQLVTVLLWASPERQQGQFSILHVKRGMIVEIEPWEMTQYVYDAVVAKYLKMEKLG